MTKVIHKSKGLTPEIIAELEALERMPDEDIDLTEMPEWTDFSRAVRGKFYRPVKQQVTLRLDADILHWFKTRQRGKRGYQTAINAALREVVERERGKGE
ncbi:MAG: BrnA antitoxin family protein [Sphingomonadaceae bacterium]|nr:BrnA antitoxin family protein [Sphingomonadaceae bacterium]